MPEQKRISQHISTLEALQREHFTPEELADLLGVSPDVIREAVRRHELRGYTVDHRIVDITRTEALKWLNDRRNR